MGDIPSEELKYLETEFHRLITKVIEEFDEKDVESPTIDIFVPGEYNKDKFLVSDSKQSYEIPDVYYFEYEKRTELNYGIIPHLVLDIKTNKIVTDIAEHFFEGEYWSSGKNIFLSRPASYLPTLHTSDSDSKLEKTKAEVLAFAGLLLDHSGGEDFGDELFEELLGKTIEAGNLEPINYKIYAPIVNMVSDFDQIELPDELKFANYHPKNQLVEAKIRPLTPDILAGVYTEAGARYWPYIDRTLHHKISHIIELEVVSPFGEACSREYMQTIGRALRLQNPIEEVVFIGPIMREYFNALRSRFDIGYTVGLGPPEFSLRPPYLEETYGLTQISPVSCNKPNDLEDFIKEYSPHLAESRDLQITSSLRRYDEMFIKLYLEDRLVDCAIGIEASLLRDLGRQSSYSFRMKLRGSALLQLYYDASPEDVQQFFSDLYAIRSDIVHQDQPLEDLIQKTNFRPTVSAPDRYPTGSEFMLEARKILSQIILAYIKLYIKYDLGVTEINQKIDRIILSISNQFSEDQMVQS